MREQQFVFATFKLDAGDQQLWNGAQLIPLRPKLFAVLQRLLQGAGRLVTREELRAAAWPDTTVSESVLRGTIRELRDVLGDDANAARFIETLPHRGYRFIAPVQVTVARAAAPVHPAPVAHARADQSILIGRAAELTLLQQALERARNGARQVVFLSGEPGIGKTAMVDAFLAAAAALPDVWSARGQCIEHYGAGESYLPVLEALGQLCRQRDGAQITAGLIRHAPTWLAQMPSLIGDADLETVQRRAQGSSRERMLRELSEAIDALTAKHTLVLALEDLHWSDYSTLDLVSLIAQRRAPARLLLLGTFRPADIIAGSHPLRAIKQELLVHDQCVELPLPFLTDAQVGEYLATRFPQQQLPAELGGAIHRGTEGNPLFMINIVDYWLSQHVLIEAGGTWRLAARVEDVAAGVPESLRQMIEKQLERLSADERHMLEVAGVAGAEFSTAVVAAALNESEERVEQWCEGLAGQGRFLVARGMETLPGGGATGRYRFIHALYQQVLYERMAAARRARLHQRIGEWRAGAASRQVSDPAAELAMHFERGQSYPRAIEYLAQAADNAMRRQAPHEAVVLLRRALALLPHLPEAAERDQQELALLVALGVPLLMTKGYAAAEVEQTYARARALCGRIGDSLQLLPALAGLARFHMVRAEFSTARAVGEQIQRLAEHTGDPLLFLITHSLLGAICLSSGDLVDARVHLERGIALYDVRVHRFMASVYGDDPGVTCHSFMAMANWLLGYPDQALASVQQALAVAKETGNQYCETFALDFVTWIHVLRREESQALASITALMNIAPEHEFQFLLADSGVLRGWTLAAQGDACAGLQVVRPAIAAYEATGALMSRPAHLLLLARTYSAAGQADAAAATLADAHALMMRTGERTYEAELYRLQGELALTQMRGSKATAEAERRFQQAIEVARRQQSKSLELRATMSLARVWQHQGESQRAQEMLGEVYRWFDEGFDTPDLVEAQALLAALEE